MLVLHENRVAICERVKLRSSKYSCIHQQIAQICLDRPDGGVPPVGHPTSVSPDRQFSSADADRITAESAFWTGASHAASKTSSA